MITFLAYTESGDAETGAAAEAELGRSKTAFRRSCDDLRAVPSRALLRTLPLSGGSAVRSLPRLLVRSCTGNAREGEHSLEVPAVLPVCDCDAARTPCDPRGLVGDCWTRGGERRGNSLFQGFLAHSSVLSSAAELVITVN